MTCQEAYANGHLQLDIILHCTIEITVASSQSSHTISISGHVTVMINRDKSVSHPTPATRTMDNPIYEQLENICRL